MYAWNVLAVLVPRKITWRSAIGALRERPVAVAGRGGSHALDPDFE